MRVLIAGGGIGGLTLAIALAKRGVDAAVFEAAPEIQPVGAGITLWPNAIRALRTIGIGDAVVAAGARIDRGQLRDPDGAVLTESDQRWLEAEAGAPAIALHRADLQRILVSALPAGVITVGARLTGFDQNTPQVRVRFADGSSAEGDVLIGADGLYSAVRASLRPETTPRYAGYVAWRGVVDADHGIRPNATSETWGRGSRFGIVPIGAGRVYWFATANRARGLKISAGERHAELLQRFGSWHQPIRGLLEATPADRILENDIEDLVPFHGWSGGRVGLLGDAAHATTPNLGQGACMAIESALVLADQLATSRSISAALDAYERARWPRTSWITRQSWRVGVVGQWANPLLCAVRAQAVRRTPASSTQRLLRRATGLSA